MSTGVVVEEIDWGSDVVELRTSAGTIRAGSVVVTVPVELLRLGAIGFTPALPASASSAIAAIRTGVLSKTFVHFPRDRSGRLTWTGTSILGPVPGRW